ncbi:MAG TPA: DUF2721 domain-containing protein [Gemmatimonadales bacterium]|nr:DUF2721 domain-containing protein [Gemmatimonadales bacterium]
MQHDTAVAAVAHTIQLAVAPVFLLSGVGGMLAVLTSRLARVVDRSRGLQTQLPATAPEAVAGIHEQLHTMARRANLISHAIAYCTVTALLVCAVIVVLFVGAFVQFDASVPVALLFVAAMIALFIGLLSFLREIFIATANLRIRPQ